ncbi:MAG TPA: toll/interleukin-1 receptor domain-containing protein [Allosphingosinicella sp.]|jgi:tetratricopeptide (TPR) repeat protein|nr:toll/interleukin-1 receptor domain-containing protein [Allosphingosinicella sp.]
MKSDRPFRAFVSYSHADSAFAGRLQRRLEAYRLPRRLAGEVVPLPGQAPGRIGPVFRDRADLSAATDLSAAVREAIAASSALVVVASPDAAESQWVAREIALFREIHPDAPILVALARGEPSEALPEALRGGQVEPLCADFRKSGDGRRLAFLKIVAGLADLPLDALVQRDAQRQVRRVTAVTLGAVLLMLIMALLLVMALRARAEAERRRVTADEMINKLLTEVRGEFEGTGNVKLMVAVNQLAMDYYGKQGDRRLADASLAQRARVLHALGQDDEKQGRYDAALAKFTEAHRTTAAMLAKSRNDPDSIFAHAQSEYYLGLIAKRRKDRAEASRRWRNYLGQAQALAKAEPGSVRSLLEQGYANGNLCDLNREDGFDLKAAESQCVASIEFEEAALAKSPELLVALANRHGAMALTQVALERYDDALASRRREAALLDPLIAIDPGNVEYALRRSWSDIGVANVRIVTRRPAEAVAVLRQCLERQRGVFSLRSDDGRIVETKLRTLLYLAKALLDLGQNPAPVLAEAGPWEAAMARFGADSATKAKTMRAKIMAIEGK